MWLLALKDSTSSSEWVGAGQVPGEGHGSSSVSSTQLQVSRLLLSEPGDRLCWKSSAVRTRPDLHDQLISEL